MPRPKGLPKTGGRRRKAETPRIETVYRPIAWFQPYERNPRKNDKAVERIRASIREFGFAVPILARSTGEVIDGHLRLKGAQAEKLTELPVIFCDGWSGAQVKAFRLMVNRSVMWADWDLDALALEFAELKNLDFDLSMTGFDSAEIERLTRSKIDAEAKLDQGEALARKWKTAFGQRWGIGRHTLLIEDSVLTGPGGINIDGIVSDPPYDNDIEEIINAAMDRWGKVAVLLRRMKCRATLRSTGNSGWASCGVSGAREKFHR